MKFPNCFFSLTVLIVTTLHCSSFILCQLSFNPPSLSTLVPDASIDNERILLQGRERIGHKFYILEKLRPNTNYEIKISYPATTPTKFEMDLLPLTFLDKHRGATRTILNTEKLMFRTDEKGLLAFVSSSGPYLVRIIARHAGISHDYNNFQSQVEFNIVLSTLTWGVPGEVAKLAMIIISGIIIIVWVLTPSFMRMLYRKSE